MIDPMTAASFSTFKDNDLEALRRIVGPNNVSTEEAELLVHAMDAFPGDPVKPDVVVWPDTAGQVSEIAQYANIHRLPIVPRGAGSSLSGNVVPAYRGIVLSLRKLNKIIQIRPRDLQVVVQPGVVYDEMNARLKPYNLFFPPNPGSFSVCTIGGMVANNASGMGAVKYGVTREYVLKLQVVLPDGNIINSGSNAFKSSTGYDLVGLFVGSEGTLGIITKITLKLKALPIATKTALAYFNSISDTTDTVSDMIGSGLSPASLEFLDHETILAINKSEGLGLSEQAAMLLTEFHGTQESTTYELNRATEICKKHNVAEFHVAKDETERAKLWAGRKGAYAALLRSSANTIVGDVVVPPSKITEMVHQTYEIADKNNVKVACFGHSGDGNVHPNVMADKADKQLWDRALRTNARVGRARYRP